MKKILLAVTLACAGLSGVASAAGQAAAPAAAGAPALVDQRTQASVKKMLDAMQVRAALVNSFSEMEKVMPDLLRSQVQASIDANTNMDAAAKQKAKTQFENALPQVTAAVTRLFRDPAMIDEMIAEMAPLYARHFTGTEIEQLAQFYSTPLGRKVMSVMPQLTAESMMMSQQLVAPRVNRLINELMQSAPKQ